MCCLSWAKVLKNRRSILKQRLWRKYEDRHLTSQKYNRVLLKLSGEALMGQQQSGLDPSVLDRIAGEIKEIVLLDVQLGVVIGGGNFCRGAQLSAAGMDRVASDHMGMLATVMNALALQDALERVHILTRVMSAISLDGVCERYDRREAIRHLQKGQIVIFSGGTGNPFFTTDSAASLRAIEINADVLLKATKVDGVYSADPVLHAGAVRYENLTFKEAIERELAVMDLAALCMCRDYHMPIRVFNINKAGTLLRVVTRKNEGTLVE